jgi:hypothetical protein
MQRALESTFECFYAALAGAWFERRTDLTVALCPRFPIPQCNGPWIIDDTDAAVDALPAVIAEVDAAGARPWVQTRTGHERTRRASEELGLTYRERIPGMAIGPGELVEAPAEIEIALISEGDRDTTAEILAECFEAPKQLFEEFCGPLGEMDEASWY